MYAVVGKLGIVTEPPIDDVTLIVRVVTAVKLHSDVFDNVRVMLFLCAEVPVPGNKTPFAYKPDVTREVFVPAYVNP
jgi:hypothetical protein